MTEHAESDIKKLNRFWLSDTTQVRFMLGALASNPANIEGVRTFADWCAQRAKEHLQLYPDALRFAKGAAECADAARKHDNIEHVVGLACDAAYGAARAAARENTDDIKFHMAESQRQREQLRHIFPNPFT